MTATMRYPHTSGGFTLPGEAGYEKLTLELAEKWGADVIRDSDGTKLSDEIVGAGYGIYSTICIIREHNAWLREHMEALQQSFLMSQPRTAFERTLKIRLLDGYFEEQFSLNTSEASLAYWQVFDRTSNSLLPRTAWHFLPGEGSVVLREAEPGHEYTVNFLSYRLWEEINMYNHVTNHWEKEHLMPVDPRHPGAQQYLLDWLKNWCEHNPDTTVVRFTSLFYNFVWIWGSDVRRRNYFTDWGSYDFTVSPEALQGFEAAYGYALTAEDFICMGRHHATHMAPTQKLKDYMAYTNRFVIEFGKQLVALVHSFDKLAYIFYDDSWVGLEPYFPSFHEFGFDGIIKCIFSGYEVRLCAGACVSVHEVRLHPYLFPVGLGGAPTFSEGGEPKRDAQRYWVAARRAMLRAKIERIGLGGYLHLLEAYPEFVDYVAELADEFRALHSLHELGAPETLDMRIAVLTAWGRTRSWTLSGHFHETWQHDLIHINEAMAGWPVQVTYLDFEDIKRRDLSEFDCIINAGFAGSAWSGGDAWADEAVLVKLRAYVRGGGCFVGVYQPSMLPGYHRNFRLADVLGVDQDLGERCCHGRISYTLSDVLSACGQGLRCAEFEKQSTTPGIYLTDMDTQVLAETLDYSPIGEAVHTPTVTLHPYGEGSGLYLSHFSYSPDNSRLLLNLLLHVCGKTEFQARLGDNASCEAAVFPDAGKLMVVNQSDKEETVRLNVSGKERVFRLAPYGSCIECL